MTSPRRQPARRRTTVLGRRAVLATVPVAVAALVGAAGPAGAGTTGAAGAGDPYFPLSGNGGYHVRHYDLTLRYQSDGRLEGTAVLTARATQPLTRFDLDLKGLTVGGVKVDRTAAGFKRSGQELVVTPATPCARARTSRSPSPTTARPNRSPTPTARRTAGSPPTTARSSPMSPRAR